MGDSAVDIRIAFDCLLLRLHDTGLSNDYVVVRETQRCADMRASVTVRALICCVCVCAHAARVLVCVGLRVSVPTSAGACKLAGV